MHVAIVIFNIMWTSFLGTCHMMCVVVYIIMTTKLCVVYMLVILNSILHCKNVRVVLGSGNCGYTVSRSYATCEIALLWEAR